MSLQRHLGSEIGICGCYCRKGEMGHTINVSHLGLASWTAHVDRYDLRSSSIEHVKSLRGCYAHAGTGVSYGLSLASTRGPGVILLIPWEWRFHADFW